MQHEMVRAGGFRVRKVFYQPGERHARHAHDDIQVSVIVRGSMTETVSDGTRTLTPGDVIVKPAGTIHENHYHGDGVTIICIDTAGEGSVSPSRFRYAAGHRAAVVASAMRLCARPSPSSAEDDIAEILAAVEIIDEGARPDWLLTRAASQLIEDRIAEPLALGAIAAELRVHRIHLARQFRRATGKSVGEHIRDLRVRRALLMIGSTRDRLAEIALKCGFADQAHMTRLFRATTGVSPRAYRQIVAS